MMREDKIRTQARDRKRTHQAKSKTIQRKRERAAKWQAQGRETK